ncbi:hypothetical protein LINGRAHAP2_LOCUS2254 [Linum grandiflorum]
MDFLLIQTTHLSAFSIETILILAPSLNSLMCVIKGKLESLLPSSQ